MKIIFPGKFNKHWLVFFLINIILIGAVLSICSIVYFKQNINFRYIMSLFIISVILSSITSASGYFGARIVSAFSLLGITVGILFMIYAYATKTGFGDIAGLMLLIMIYLIGLSIGIIAEIIVYYKKHDKSNSDT